MPRLVGRNIVHAANRFNFFQGHKCETESFQQSLRPAVRLTVGRIDKKWQQNDQQITAGQSRGSDDNPARAIV